MTECICQLCGKFANCNYWSPKSVKATFRMLGIKGSNLPVCVTCMLEKVTNPQFFIKSMEEFLRMAKKEGYKVEGKYDIDEDPESDH